MPPGLGQGGGGGYPLGVKLNISRLPALVTIDRGEERLGFLRRFTMQDQRLRDDHHWIDRLSMLTIDATHCSAYRCKPSMPDASMPLSMWWHTALAPCPRLGGSGQARPVRVG
jgi:hypothetical protein